MAATLRINGRDYSPFLKLFTEDQVGVVDAERLSPQFAGNAALSEGAVWIGTSSVNKHWQVAMIVRGASLTVDSVNQMVRDIRGDLYRGAVVEYAPDGASQTTFFELEAGEFRPVYSHPRYRHGYVEGVLELWTRPYGNTGTTRLIASAAGTGVLELLATGIVGDAPALGNIGWWTGSQIPGFQARFAAYGVARSASYVGLRVASAIGTTFDSTATLVGASGALGSQYLGLNAVTYPTAAFQVTLAPVDAYVGQHRVFAIARQRALATGAVALRLVDAQFNRALTASAYVPNGASSPSWQVVDLGEINVSKQDAAATQYRVGLGLSLASSAVGATRWFDLNAIVCVPVDQSAAVVVDYVGGPGTASGVPGAQANSWAGVARSRIELHSHPTNVAVWASQGSADVGRLSNVRGGPPRLPPTGSPAASTGYKIVAFSGFAADYRGNDVLGVSIEARESFSFYR